LASKRVRAEVEEGQALKPRLPSCLVGATPEINSSALQARGNQHAAGGAGGGLTVAALGGETDPHRLRQRQKQVDYGKNTLGYDRYTQLVPKERRRRTDPRTPDIHARISTKRFNGLVRAWRRRLHEFDPQDGTAAGASSSSSSSPSSISAPRAGVPSYAAVVKTPGSSSRHNHSHTPNRGGGGNGGMQNKPVSHDDDSSGSDGEEGEEIIITQQGGPGSTSGKGRDKKKSRVSPYYRAPAGEAAAEEMGGVENDFPALASGAAVTTGGEQAGRIGGTEGGEGEGDFYEIKRSTAMGAGIGGACSSGSSSKGNTAGCAGGAQRVADDEELCYSDDDLL